MSYLGIPPFGRTARTVTEVIATSGQTTFYPSGGYTVGYIDVTLNGITLLATDFTATDGLSVVLNSAAVLNDELKFTSYTVNLYDGVPNPSGNAGKYLKTDGTTNSWASVEALPSQTGNTGKYLKTDGTTASWQLAAVVGPVNTNTSAITADYAIPTGTNAQSIGPITQAANTTLTIASGQRWQII
jgi:hypothetical protein